jgi:choice-of-anchor A domain-containing protein
VVQASHGETCDPPGSAAGGNGQNCRSDCTVCGDGVVQAADGETCDEGSPTATCDNTCAPPPTPGCPTAFLGGGGVTLGAAANFAVLVLDSPFCSSDVVLSAPASEIDGKVAICAGVTGDILKLKIDGDLILDTTDGGTNPNIHSDVKFSGGHGIVHQDLHEACGTPPFTPPPPFADPGDCREASTAALALSTSPGCTQTIPSVTSSALATFNGNGGLNVICIGNINLVKQTITFNGNASDRFIINITGQGDHILNNVRIVLNGVQPNQILWNVTAVGTTVSFFKPDATLAGTWLVPDGSFIQDHGRLDGTVCAGCTAKFHSGAVVSCPDP